MLNRKYDPMQPYRYLRYGRMSDPKQNPRSPDQQFDTVETTRTRLSYPWVHVKTYRDDGISGRFMRKRTGLQDMLRDIEVGLVRVDLIAVDTLERLGRADEIAELRRKLLTEYGILVVTADSNFADPTGVTGQALGLVENIRATEDGRVKAHNVIRGKKDAAELKWWPGGPPPLGFTLKPVLEESATARRMHSVLEPVPAHVAAVRLAFARADETGHGALRLARWWNECSDIPDDLKPMSPHTMGYVLSNPIYVGTLVWGANTTGIVNDTRVIEPNPDGPRVVVPDFCPPVVDRAVFERVQQLRSARSALTRSLRAGTEESGEPAKLIAPQGRGMTLKYLLTGLVRCGCCRSSMRPIPSKRRTESGRRYEYVHYACPRAGSGACKNDRYVREDHLREAVVARLRGRLFPTPGAPDQVPDWFPDLVSRVQKELERHHAAEPDRKAVREAELRELGERLAGWMLTLGDPKLPPTVRTDITTRYEQAQSRRAELEAQVEGERALGEHLGRALDPRVVVEQLHRLGDVLAGHNPTLGNLELSRHIDHILCFPDGRVEMRGTWLGVFDGAVHLLSRTTDSPSPPDRFPGVTPRKRGRLRLPNLSAESGVAMADVNTCLDPERFAGLADAFFWSEDVTVERALSWAEANSEAVAQARSRGRTHEQLADEFNVSVPTIRKALRIAAQSDSELSQLPRKMPRAKWQDSHADEVRALKQEGRTVKQLAAHFEVSEPLIRAALALAAKKSSSTGESAEIPQDPPAPLTSNDSQ
jgi:DNA invertase Pin-like site-specific DNA recombinase